MTRNHTQTELVIESEKTGERAAVEFTALPTTSASSRSSSLPASHVSSTNSDDDDVADAAAVTSSAGMKAHVEAGGGEVAE